MNKLFTLTAIVFFALATFAQSPEKMSYQAVIRNAAGELIKLQPVGMQVSILQGSADGILEFSETHEATSNENGLVSIEIGAGVLVNGSFAAIDWSAGPYFLKTETDPEGGFNYTISGTSQLLSVPYAMHAKTAETISGELVENDPLFGSSVAAGITTADTARWNAPQGDESDPVFSEWDKSSGITINKSQISDLGVVVETETDPVFEESAAANISQYNIYKWNQKLETESDPVYKKSVAAGISSADTANWNNKLEAETDPAFTAWNKSSGITITESQITDLAHFTNADETDPVFGATVAAAITSADTANWNSKLAAETDPAFSAWNKSSGITITESQISDLAHFTNADETDPVFVNSAASGISTADISNWNSKIDSYTESQNLQDVLAKGNNGGNVQIKNIANPTDSLDVVNKAYLDYMLIKIGDTQKLLYAGYSPEQLLNGGHTLSDLLNAGYTYYSVLLDIGVTVQELLNAGVPLKELVAAPSISIAYLLDNGVTINDLLSVGVSYADLLAAGQTLEDLLAAGIPLGDLLVSGISADDFIGVKAFGGIIFYLNQITGKGMVCSQSDQGSTDWGCPGTFLGAKVDDIGSGLNNTNTIVAKCSSTTNAASICYNLELNGYSDWYLPSVLEMDEVVMKANKVDPYLLNLGSFYWTSSEYDGDDGLVYNVYNESYGISAKGNSRRVRAIRTFNF